MNAIKTTDMAVAHVLLSDRLFFVLSSSSYSFSDICPNPYTSNFSLIPYNQ